MSPQARYLLRLLLGSATVLIVLHVLSKIAFRLGLAGRHVSNFFSVSHEMNLPTWFSATQLAAVGILSLLVSRFSKFEISPRASRWFWSILGIGFLALSIDESCSLHEYFDKEHFNPSLADHWVYNLAPAVALAAAVFFFVGYRLLHYHPSVLKNIAIGGGLLALGAMGMDLLFTHILYDKVARWERWGSHSLVSIPEEFLEMAGVALILSAVLDYFLKTLDTSRLPNRSGSEQ